MKPRLCAAIMIGLAVALLAGSRASVLAQPVASIALPAPGELKELYPGCNLLSLTFPDGTTSEDVIDAVSPSGAVEALWRETATLDRFEGFSPAFPQASDLLTLHFLDPVWICTRTPIGPSPSTMPTPVPLPTPTPTPTPGTTNLAISGIVLQRPQGIVWVWLLNHGPDSLVDVTMNLQCSTKIADPFDGNLLAGGGFQAPISLSLASGKAVELQTPLTIEVSKGDYTVECDISNESFTDPDPSDNKFIQILTAQADLAVTDIFPQSLPIGEVYTRITNNGPDSLVNAPLHFFCSYTATSSTGQTSTKVNPINTITFSTNPGETQVFDAQISVDTSCTKYDVKCEVEVYYDPKPDDDTYEETIPMTGPCIE
jgi:hypothetical protein